MANSNSFISNSFIRFNLKIKRNGIEIKKMTILKGINLIINIKIYKKIINNSNLTIEHNFKMLMRVK